jgi:hypothetical protein
VGIRDRKSMALEHLNSELLGHDVVSALVRLCGIEQDRLGKAIGGTPAIHRCFIDRPIVEGMQHVLVIDSVLSIVRGKFVEEGGTLFQCVELPMVAVACSEHELRGVIGGGIHHAVELPAPFLRASGILKGQPGIVYAHDSPPAQHEVECGVQILISNDVERIQFSVSLVKRQAAQALF